jgi:hypothetical protein
MAASSHFVAPRGTGELICTQDADEWTINISGEASLELTRLVTLTGNSVGALIALAITFLGVIVDADKEDKRVFLTSHNGRLLEELYIPKKK